MAKVIGLTGGIASGKSTVASELRRRGAAVVDADQIARQVVEPGQPALAELVGRFGAGIIAADGRLDRKLLAEQVFSDLAARSDLNRITHPRIAAASQAAIARLAQTAPVVFYEAALLVENRAHEWLDAVVVVAAPMETQKNRLMARDGIDEPAAIARLGAQLPLEDKLRVATWVLDNRGDLAGLTRQIDALWADLEARYGMVVGSPTMADPEFEPMPPRPAEHLLISGFPRFPAVRMARMVLDRDPCAMVYLLVTSSEADEAHRFIAGIPETHRARVKRVTGDICAMDLGLATAEYQALAATITTIHHLAETSFWEVDAELALRINVHGTRGVVDFANDCRRLRRVIHWSSVQVSGKRTGVVLEDELDVGQGFHNPYEETKLAGEMIARSAMRKLPVTIVRPGIIVGDSATGEIDKLDGVYGLFTLFATNAWPVHLPLLGRGSAPLYLTPIDYLIEAGHQLGNDERAAGRTVHLVDPNPLPARRVLELVAAAADTPEPRGFVPAGLARAVLRVPGLKRLTRAPAAILDLLSTPVIYHQKNAMDLLAEAGIACPSFESYVGNLVRFVRQTHARELHRPPAVDDESRDPLA